MPVRLPRRLTQRGQRRRRGHAARLAGRGAARARRRRLPAARRRAVRQLAAGDRQGTRAQAYQRWRRGRQRARGGRVDPVHARRGGTRRRRARARRHAGPRLQRWRRPHGARLGPDRGRGGVARVVRRRGDGAGGGARAGRPPAAGRGRARRAPLRHPDAHAESHAMVIGGDRADGPAARRARLGRRGGGHRARVVGRAPPLHRGRGQDTPLGSTHVGMHLQSVVGSYSGGYVPGDRTGPAWRLGSHRLEGPLRTDTRHAATRHRRLGGQRAAAAGAPALRRRAGAGAGRAARAVQRLARHQPQAVGPGRQLAHTQRDERAQGLGDGRVRGGRRQRAHRAVLRARRLAARLEPRAAARRAARAPARRRARARRAPARRRPPRLHGGQRRRRARLASHGAVNQRRPHKMLAHPQVQMTSGGARVRVRETPHDTATRLAVTRAAPHDTATRQAVTRAASHDTATRLAVTRAAPHDTATRQAVTRAAPHDTATRLAVTRAAPHDTATRQAVTRAAPHDTATRLEHVYSLNAFTCDTIKVR